MDAASRPPRPARLLQTAREEKAQQEAEARALTLARSQADAAARRVLALARERAELSSSLAAVSMDPALQQRHNARAAELGRLRAALEAAQEVGSLAEADAEAKLAAVHALERRTLERDAQLAQTPAAPEPAGFLHRP